MASEARKVGAGRWALARYAAVVFHAHFGQRPAPSAQRPAQRCFASGFTLIEVLAALVIVSLGMLGVIQAVSQTVSNSSYLRDKTIAHWVAMNRLTETRLQASAPPIEESSGEVDMAGQRWRWTMNVSKTAVENVRRIDVNVTLAGADKKFSLASMTGFFGATVAPPGTALVVWDASPANAPGTPTGTAQGGLTIGGTSPPPTPAPTPVPTPAR